MTREQIINFVMFIVYFAAANLWAVVALVVAQQPGAKVTALVVTVALLVAAGKHLPDAL